MNHDIPILNHYFIIPWLCYGKPHFSKALYALGSDLILQVPSLSYGCCQMGGPRSPQRSAQLVTAGLELCDMLIFYDMLDEIFHILVIWLEFSDKIPMFVWEKNGKRGMLGHPSVHCWLLCFLCYGSMFHPYLWCFSCGGFWDFFARTFTSLFGFRWGGDLLLLLCFFENGFVLELSLLNTSFVVFDFSLQM